MQLASAEGWYHQKILGAVGEEPWFTKKISPVGNVIQHEPLMIIKDFLLRPYSTHMRKGITWEVEKLYNSRGFLIMENHPPPSPPMMSSLFCRGVFHSRIVATMYLHEKLRSCSVHFWYIS